MVRIQVDRMGDIGCREMIVFKIGLIIGVCKIGLTNSGMLDRIGCNRTWY